MFFVWSRVLMQGWNCACLTPRLDGRMDLHTVLSGSLEAMRRRAHGRFTRECVGELPGSESLRLGLFKSGGLNILAALQSAGIAQLVEHLIRNEEVGCSIHPAGTTDFNGLFPGLMALVLLTRLEEVEHHAGFGQT